MVVSVPGVEGPLEVLPVHVVNVRPVVDPAPSVGNVGTEKLVGSGSQATY